MIRMLVLFVLDAEAAEATDANQLLDMHIVRSSRWIMLEQRIVRTGLLYIYSPCFGVRQQ